MSRQEKDDAIAAENQANREDRVQEALLAYRDFLRAKKAFEAASARLIPHKAELVLLQPVDRMSLIQAAA